MKFRSGLAVILLTITGAACSSSSTTTTGSPTPTATSGGSTGNSVRIGGLQFIPKDLTVPAGTTVKWTWSTGDTQHNVVASNGEWKSGDPSSTGNFEQKFDVKGSTEIYYCEVHGNKDGSGMSGTITVS